MESETDVDFEFDRFQRSLAPVLHEGRELADAVIKGTCIGIEFVRVPVNTRDTAFVSPAVDGFDQGSSDSRTTRGWINIQIFQVAVTGARPCREMNMLMHEAAQLPLMVFGSEAAQR